MRVGGSAPVWIHLLRIQTTTDVFEVECAKLPCMMGAKQINLGDSITFRSDKKWLYVAPDPNDPKAELKYKIHRIVLVAPSQETKSAN